MILKESTRVATFQKVYLADFFRSFFSHVEYWPQIQSPLFHGNLPKKLMANFSVGFMKQTEPALCYGRRGFSGTTDRPTTDCPTDKQTDRQKEKPTDE